MSACQNITNQKKEVSGEQTFEELKWELIIDQKPIEHIYLACKK